TLPAYITGAMSHSRWAMVILLIVLGVMAATIVFSYLFLWTVSPEIWPGRDAPVVSAGVRLAAIALYLAAMALMILAGRMLPGDGKGRARSVAAIFIAAAMLAAAFVVEFQGYRASGVKPAVDAHGAILHAAVGLQGLLVASAILMTGFVLLRILRRRTDALWRNSFDNAALYFHFTAATGITFAAFFHLFPWLAG
ncbi:MAG TPA: hypothetical protein VIK87_12025, partial [Sphingomonadales bacterium]